MPASASSKQSMEQLMEFVLVKNGSAINSWVFLIPPESMEQQEPTRANNVRTQAGGYSDLFGGDFPTIALEGTTGYSVRAIIGGQAVDGYQHWLNFLQEIHRVFINSPLTDPNNNYELHYYNWTHRQYYSIMPTNVAWDMAIPENTVFYYNIEATGIEPLLQPNGSSPGLSYSQLINNNTANFIAVAANGATHGAMSLKLLGYA